MVLKQGHTACFLRNINNITLDSPIASLAFLCYDFHTSERRYRINQRCHSHPKRVVKNQSPGFRLVLLRPLSSRDARLQLGSTGYSLDTTEHTSVDHTMHSQQYNQAEIPSLHCWNAKNRLSYYRSHGLVFHLLRKNGMHAT